MQNAPYRVEVATSDVGKVLLTQAFTLERRRVWEADSPVAALAFSPDGGWLYAATLAGEVVALDPDKAIAQPLARVELAAAEEIISLQGAGNADTLNVAVSIGSPEPRSDDGCPTWHGVRRLLLRRAAGSGVPARHEHVQGWSSGGSGWRTSAVSPNTKFRAEVAAGNLEARGRFGATSQRVNAQPLPAGILGIVWMRDSRGIVLGHPRSGGAGRCRSGVGVRAYRFGGAPDGAWTEWALPAAIDVTRPAIPGAALDWAPDGMRWLGVGPRGVMLVEPAPRHRGPVAWIAPPSGAWPVIRPGVRPLVVASTGATLHAELLMEQGNVDAAARLLATAPAGAEVVRLRGRLDHLREVTIRRAREMDGRSDAAANARVATPGAMPDAASPTAP
ncbi:MAG: hypothetical protein EXR79_13905 [Myxococcales bacterium]|nr:hypothetical protein [Myxococcales bacterium]